MQVRGSGQEQHDSEDDGAHTWLKNKSRPGGTMPVGNFPNNRGGTTMFPILGKCCKKVFPCRMEERPNGTRTRKKSDASRREPVDQKPIIDLRA